MSSAILSPDKHLESLLPKLRSKAVTYFPVRHHSPACASHIEQWIVQNRPATILIEGPEDFSNKIDFLTDEQCLCPVAIYTSFVDKKGRLSSMLPRLSNEDHSPEEQQDSKESTDKPGEHDHAIFGPPRFAGYYPFCDYSPELVALRVGKSVGAKLRFIDLQYGEMILARFQARMKELQVHVNIESLAEDGHLRHSQYIKALSATVGCRDFNELWDHLFESGFKTLSTDAFIDRVATYCAMARLDYSDEDLERDGTNAREACMASIIADELKIATGPILVVTGGFHTVALPDLVSRHTARPPKPQFEKDETGSWLMRYSFDQLDALAGYSSGMPAPAFYDRVWSAERELASNPEGRAKRLEQVAADVLVEIGRLSRKLNLANLISTPDTVSAMQMTRQLAALRGHPWPLREDVLDGIRACYVKGEMNVEGQVILALVKDVLAGNRVGQIPLGADVPPIVDDFYRQAKKHRISVETSERKEFSLELYRNPNHRAISRFFHRLSSIDAPFGRLLAGPDFVTGGSLHLIQEQWSTSWSPMVESALIQASVYGGTIEDAAASKLKLQIASLEEQAQGRSSETAVKLLVKACRMGLHSQAASLIPLIDRHVNEDASLPSVVQALSQLELLDQSREPLEANNLTAIRSLMISAYHRACRLLNDIDNCSADDAPAIVKALQMLREIVATNTSGADAENIDTDLFFNGLNRVLRQPAHNVQSAIVGAAAGIMYGEGRLAEEDLITVVCGYLAGAFNDPKKTAGIIQGLLVTACEVTWQVSEILRALDSQFQSWDDETFLQLLPDLRLAFTALSPRDIARVAEQISTINGSGSLGELVFTDIDEDEMRFGYALNMFVRESLESDGLGEVI